MEELIIKERETKEKIVELVNNCGLPAMILKPIIKDLYEQLDIVEQQQYELAQKSLEEKNSKKEE